MNPYWIYGLLIALMLWTAGALYIGYKWSSAACEKIENQQLQTEIQARISAEKKSESISASYEISKTQNQKTIAALLMEVRQHAKTSPSCAISSNLMYQINSAATGSSSR